MIISTVQVVDHFGQVSAEIELLAVRALDAAIVVAAAVCQEAASIDLQLETIPAHGDIDGYVAGIESRKRGSKSDVRLAPIFDGGSLGARKRPLGRSNKSAGGERRRRESWTGRSPAGLEYTAHRHPETLTDSGKGIPAEEFFAKGRRAGRAAMVGKLHSGL